MVEFDLEGDPNAIQTQDDKMQKPLGKICPARLSDAQNEHLRQLARDAFNALNLCDFARIDVRMDQDGNPYILEINSMASLGGTGSYIHAAQTAGYTYETLVNRMLDVAAVRYFGQPAPETAPAANTTKADETQPLRVRSHIRSNLTTMEDNLRGMVEMDTYVHNSEGVSQLGNWLATRLAQLGFTRRVYPQTEVGNVVYFVNHDRDRNDILLLSHLDTFYSYRDYVGFREDGGRLYGSGVAESKGGLAAMLAAFQALRFTRRLRNVRCGVLLTSDDALGGRFGRKHVVELATTSRYVVGLKHGDANGGIVTTCSGQTDFQIELTNTKAATDGAAPDVIKLLAQKLSGWYRLNAPEAGIFLKPTRIEGRTLYGLAPDFATASLFLRYREEEQIRALEQQVQDIGRRNLPPKCQIRIRKTVSRAPLGERAAVAAFYETVQDIARRLEVKVCPVERTTPSDISYTPDHVPALDGLGPVGGGTRTPGEYILRDSLIDRAAVLAMVIRHAAEAR